MPTKYKKPSSGDKPDSFYEFTQGSPSTVWTITHNLGKKPTVRVFDTDSPPREVIGSISYVSSSQLTITFSAAISGVAYLN